MKGNSAESSARPAWVYVMKDIRYCMLAANGHAKQEQHGSYSLWVVTRGSGKIDMAGTVFRLEQGKCYSTPPGAASAVVSGDAGLCCYRLAFDALRTDIADGTNEPPGAGEPFPCRGEVLCHPFSQCIEHVEAIYRWRHDSDAMAVFDNHIRFQQLLRFILGQNQAAAGGTSQADAVRKSILHIEQHYTERLTVEQLAEQAAVARWKYTSIFKRMTGLTPLEYVNKIRIERAKHLLVTTNDRLYEIGQHVGFNNEYYFSRRFRQEVGISPGHYRRNHREQPRVFAPFLEDFVVALGMTPVMQGTHPGWGQQEYLGIGHVPVFDVAEGDIGALFRCQPDIILLDEGFSRWIQGERFGGLAPVHSLDHPGEDWRTTLRMASVLLGKTDLVDNIIAKYESKAGEARSRLQRTVRNGTVACLRISAAGVSLYGGPELGYTGPVLYRDLGLTPHPLVRQLASRTRKAALTVEWLARLDADHLFITFDKRHSEAPGEERDLLDSSVWRKLPAVRNRRVYEVDFWAWMNYGVIAHSRKIDDVLNALA
ncbi:MAG: AraC family transcriptional regulator [Paenibacillus dendritiformis]|uniref:AraC family transcriptional regulator n=1 Tax=Paenibacillus dendritiformis TaxID=130049 RepID=UPI00143DC7DA|nr:AraC family transcriptional regulator [Paenibacillus dendritiformis]MDU5140811.1 AraC family transcriptional regulator [Paenibacillus dendritiformis]NKI22555.1 helix-turn-helix domain-containing protein [Paenibacillus dendritiformis]NRG01213.1 AraC family transcriptional regulator [Paenibacillus dendritiformis]